MSHVSSLSPALQARLVKRGLRVEREAIKIWFANQKQRMKKTQQETRCASDLGADLGSESEKKDEEKEEVVNCPNRSNPYHK